MKELDLSDESSFVLTVSQDARRLDVWLSQIPGFHSRSQAKRLIDSGAVTVNDHPPTKAGMPLKAGDVVHVDLPPELPSELIPEPIPLHIVYEDESVIVVNKQRGMVVHPAPGHESGTLVHALLHHCEMMPEVGDAIRPGIVHRLDKNTTGLLVVAKTVQAHVSLTRQFKARKVLRQYVALVHGRFPHDRGTIDAPIGRHPVKRQRMAVVEGGRDALTQFEVMRRLTAHTLMRLSLVTGRTHQIRVHLAHVGHPIVGDAVYGRTSTFFADDGYGLHAAKLGFHHPTREKWLELEADLPPDFQRALKKLEATT